VDTSDKTLIEKLCEQSYITLKQQSLEKIAISGANSQKSFDLTAVCNVLSVASAKS
jgi:hypothetical protein